MEPDTRATKTDSVPDFAAKLPPARSGGLWIARLVLLVFGMFWLGGVATFAHDLLIQSWQGALRAVRWQETPAVVVSVERQEPDASYALVCQYVVGDQTYTSTAHVQAGREIQGVAASALQEGTELRIWYDPEDPGQAELQPTKSLSPLAFLIFMGPFALVGAAMVVGGILGTLGLELLEKEARTRSLARARAVLTGVVAFSALSFAATFLILALDSLLDWPMSWRVALGVPPAVTAGSVAAGLWDLRRRKRAGRARIEDQGFYTIRDISGSGPQRNPDLPPVGWPLIGAWTFWTLLVAGLMIHAIGSILAPMGRAQQFRSTRAQVLSAEVIASRTGGSERYRPLIVYRYEVDAETYTSDRYDLLGRSTPSRQQARTVVRRFPPGKTVRAWYDPDDPAKAVLARTATAGGWYLILFLQPFLAVSLAGALAIWLSLRHRRDVGRFLREEPSRILAIPGWGRIRRGAGQIEILSPAPKVLLAVASGGAYLGVCFLAGPLLAWIFGAGIPAWYAAGIFSLAVLAGIVAALWTARRLGERTVTIELQQRRIVLRQGRKDRKVLDLRQVRALRCIGESQRDEQQLLDHARIEAVMADGTVHLIGRLSGGDRLSTARKACRLLADWTGKPAAPAPEDSTID
jgi:uncharacterized membrane protein